MPKNKRVRIFAGPNGSGKSSAFVEFVKKYDPGVYINADEIEKSLHINRIIDFTDLGLDLNDVKLEFFRKLPRVKSLLEKAKIENKAIDVFLREGCIVNPNRKTNSYEASFVSMLIRWLCSESGTNFTFETVLSHPSKIDEIIQFKSNGFKTYLYFVCTDDAQINKARVLTRTKKGGHNVPIDRIEKRYHDSLTTLEQLIPHVDTLYFIDNSKNIEVVAIKNGAELEILKSQPPQWFIDFVLPQFEGTI